MKGPHDLFRLTTADEDTGGPRFVGAAVATERDPPSKPHLHRRVFSGRNNRELILENPNYQLEQGIVVSPLDRPYRP
jgi:hypothetical protein